MSRIAACLLAVVLELGVSHTPAQPPPPAPGAVEIDGATIAYDITGTGRNVVLLHGGLLDRRMWDPQLEALAGASRVIRVDSRGHGDSSPADGPYSNVDDLHAVLTALDVERAVIIGLSLGGRTAMDFALAHPEVVEAVIAVSPGLSGYEFVDPVLMEHWKGLRQAAEAGDLDLWVEWFQRSWTDGPKRSPSETPREVREQVRVMARRNLERRGEGELQELGAAARLREIDVPVLAVLGELDMADIHTIVRLIEEQVKGARKVVIPGAAHMVNMEKPDEFNRAVLEFLAELEGAASQPRGRRLRFTDPLGRKDSVRDSRQAFVRCSDWFRQFNFMSGS